MAYQDQPERLITMNDFYGFKSERDRNCSGEFWHAVALLLRQHYLRRERQACAFAKRWRTVVNSASRRDAELRGELCLILGLPDNSSMHDIVAEVRRLKQ